MKLERHPLLDSLEPFVVVTPFHEAGLDPKPFGVEIPRENWINPLALGSEAFLLILQTLDARTFGPEGMPMPRWVFFDCSEMPGAIFGMGRRVEDLSEEAREVLEVPDDYQGIVPFSMYIAIPMSKPGAWFGHNLCSISPTLPKEGLKGLGSFTKSVALRCFGVEEFYGATQWDSTALFIHSKFGPLHLQTAYTPAHSEEFTLTYYFEVTERGLRNAAGEKGLDMERPEPDFFLHRTDESGIIDLQDAIEAGEQFVIPSSPIPASSEGFNVPIAKL
jgi:hypothetical protein